MVLNYYHEDGDFLKDLNPDSIEILKDCKVESSLKEIENGPWRQIRFLSISGPAVPPCRTMWEARKDNVVIGRVSSAAWSPDFQTNVAIGMVQRKSWAPGTELEAVTTVTINGKHGVLPCNDLCDNGLKTYVLEL